MIQEALLSSAVSEIDTPLELQREGISHQRFIQSKKDIVNDLVSSGPIELFYDLIKLHRDFLRAAGEHTRFMMDPVYWGEGVPRGDGSRLLYLGGFMTSPWMFVDPILTFRRIGYDAVTVPLSIWGVINTKPIKTMGRELLTLIWKEAKQSGHKVKVVGESLGGLDWAAAFIENPDMFIESVDHLVCAVSPRPTRVNRALEIAYLITQWFAGEEEEIEIGNKLELLKEAQDESLIKVTTVDSSDDPVIQGHFLGKSESHFTVDEASHSGMGKNRRFIKIAANSLMGEEVASDSYTHQGSQAA